LIQRAYSLKEMGLREGCNDEDSCIRSCEICVMLDFGRIDEIRDFTGSRGKNVGNRIATSDIHAHLNSRSVILLKRLISSNDGKNCSLGSLDLANSAEDSDWGRIFRGTYCFDESQRSNMGTTFFMPNPGTASHVRLSTKKKKASLASSGKKYCCIYAGESLLP
jgi:hypothetical protein